MSKENRNPKNNILPQDKVKILAKSFLSGKKLSIKDIMELIDVNRSRAYDYINLLQEQDFDFCIEKEGRTAFYKLNGSASETVFYSPIASKDILYYHILTTLSQQPMIAEKLYTVLSEYIEIPLSTFYNAINDMLSHNLIVPSIRKENGTKNNNTRTYDKRYLYPSGIDVPLLLCISIDDQNLINAQVASGQQQGKALLSLYKKIAILLGDNEAADLDDSVFVQYGRGYHMDSNMQSYYQTLMDNQFNTRILEFKYHGKTIKFDTGMVVYSQDKDMLYLLGRKIGTHQTTILKYSEISDINTLNEPNKEYGQKKYNEFLTDMFSISSDAPEEVEIHFVYSPELHDRLIKLTLLRINAKLVRKNDKLIYTDKISGLSDFANYLRSYGSGFEIIRPAKLKKALLTTINRALSRYNGEI